MKTLKFFQCAALLLLLTTSCRNDDLSPIITFDSAIKGAYVRLIDETDREFDLEVPALTHYEYTIEFVDFERGALVDQYDIYASFEDNNPDNGDASTDLKHLETFLPSDFGQSENGYLSLTVTLTLEELSSSLGVQVEDIQALDRFKIESKITTMDGKTFMASNSSVTVNGSAFQGHFKFSIRATCPLPDDLFVGEYVLYNLNNCEWGCSLGYQPITLRPSSISSTKREFDARYLEVFGGFDVHITVEFLCDEAIMLKTDTGVGCGDNILFLPGTPQPFDISDPNGIITLEFIEDTGDCEAGVTSYIIELRPVG